MDYWKYHNSKMQELNKLYKKTSKQTQLNLQEVFSVYKITSENLYNIADSKNKQMVDTYIEKMQDEGLLKGYFGYMSKNIYRRSRVKNSEILEILIYGAYIEEQAKLEKQEKKIMKDDVNYYYEQGQEEVNKTLPLFKKKKTSVITDTLFIYLLSLANARGYIYEEYKEAVTKTNADSIYRQAVINISQNKENDINDDIFQNIIKKQQNQRLCINGDKISGYMDNQLIGMNNYAKIEGIKAVNEDAQVRFLAITDEKSTSMCQSLKDQIFWVNKENTFYRMYGETSNELRNEKITCQGLVLGLNLPPISHHWHWCRSTITYNTNYISKNLMDADIQSKENKNALINYISSESYKINSKLYNNEELSKEDKEYIENLDKVLKGMPIYKGWVNRSVYCLNQRDLNDILSIFKNEQKIGCWKSYVSASKGIYDEKFNLQFKIKSKTGRNLSSINNEGGGEIVFMRNTQFQLIDIKNKDGIIYIKLEEI